MYVTKIKFPQLNSSRILAQFIFLSGVLLTPHLIFQLSSFTDFLTGKQVIHLKHENALFSESCALFSESWDHHSHMWRCSVGHGGCTLNQGHTYDRYALYCSPTPTSFYTLCISMTLFISNEIYLFIYLFINKGTWPAIPSLWNCTLSLASQFCPSYRLP